MDEKLRASVREAKKTKGFLNLEDLKDVNRRIEGKIYRKTKKRARPEDNSLEKIRKLHKRLDFNIQSRTGSVSDKKIVPMERVINAFTHNAKASHLTSFIKPNIEKVFKIFKKLIKLKVNSDLFNSCTLMKTVKTYSREFKKNEDRDLSKLTEVASLLINNWSVMCLLENSRVSEDVVDSSLQNSGFKKIYRALHDKGFDKHKSQSLSAACEESIRQTSGNNSTSYKLALSHFLGQITELNQQSIVSLITKFVV